MTTEPDPARGPDIGPPAGVDQSALWNGPAGHGWVAAQETLDRMFAGFETMLAGAVAEGNATDVLDVGCGTGATTLAVARRVGDAGAAVGIDLSEPMLARARERAGTLPATFVRGDAGTHPFPPAGFDRIVSRFGVMFFADPVAAFANLRAAARTGAELDAFAWRGPADNPFMTTAERAAAPFLAEMPARDPRAPGQFAFADADRVSRILSDSGWRGIAIEPADVACSFPVAGLVPFLTRLGPVGLALRDADAATRVRVIDTVRAAFDPFVEDDAVRYVAACWRLRATA
jgi:SAM-dependent methyltransferase